MVLFRMTDDLPAIECGAGRQAMKGGYRISILSSDGVFHAFRELSTGLAHVRISDSPSMGCGALQSVFQSWQRVLHFF